MRLEMLFAAAFLSACTDGAAFATGDGRVTMFEVVSELGGSGVGGIAIASTGEVYSTAGGGLRRLDGLTAAVPLHSTAQIVAIDADDAIFVRTTASTLERSIDGGATFTPVTITGFGAFVAGLLSNREGLFVAVDVGPDSFVIAKSIDHGATWTQVSTPFGLLCTDHVHLTGSAPGWISGSIVTTPICQQPGTEVRIDTAHKTATMRPALDAPTSPSVFGDGVVVSLLPGQPTVHPDGTPLGLVAAWSPATSDDDYTVIREVGLPPAPLTIAALDLAGRLYVAAQAAPLFRTRRPIRVDGDERETALVGPGCSTRHALTYKDAGTQHTFRVINDTSEPILVRRLIKPGVETWSRYEPLPAGASYEDYGNEGEYFEALAASDERCLGVSAITATTMEIRVVL